MDCNVNYEIIAKQVRRNNDQKLAVICYARYEDKILFLKRKYEPFSGFLVPPGGKVEKDEEIENAVRREYLEETGLVLENLELRVVTSEIGPQLYNWILFIFVGKVNSNKTIDCSEGELIWVNESDLFQNLSAVEISPIDKALIPYIFKPGIKLAFIDYSEDKKIKRLDIINCDSNLSDLWYN
ncbi:MAG: NUDIX domain-containing protein [Fervidobacterium sp.]